MSHTSRRRVEQGRKDRSTVRLLLALAVVTTVIAGVFTFTQHQGPSTEDFCAQLELVSGLDETLATLDPLTVPGVSAQLRSLEDQSPDGIRAEVAVLADFTDRITDAVAGAPGREARAVEDVARSADLGAVTDAGRAVEQYAATHCDIDLVRATTPESVTPPPTQSPTSTTR